MLESTPKTGLRPSQRHAYVASGIFTIAILVFGALTSLSSHDTFGYVAMGRDFLEHGLSLFTDHLSITHLGQRLLPNPWLFSLIAGAADVLAGTSGLFGLFAILWATPVLAILIWAYRNHIDGLSVFAVVFFLASSFLTRVQLRPELVAYTFLFLGIILSHQYLLDGRWRWLAALSTVFVIWTQFHSTSSMMLPIFGAAWLHGLAAETRVTEPTLRKKTVFKHVLWLVGFILLGFVNPNGFEYHPFALANVHQNEWVGVISEYLGDQKFTTLTQWLNFLGGASLLVYFLNTGDLAKSGVLAVMMYYGWQIPKLAPHVSVAIGTHFLLMIAGLHNSSRQAPSVWLWFKNSGSLIKSPNLERLRVPAIAIFLVGTTFQLSKQVGPLSEYSLLRGASPINHSNFAVDVAEHLKAHELVGPTLSELGTAGYLEYAVGRPISLYVDQRVGILIPKEIFDVYREAIMREKALIELTAKHQFKALVGSNNWPERLVDTALRTKKFSIRFVGNSHSVLVPTESAQGFDQISWLMHDPSCLKKIDLDNLALERAKLANDQSTSAMLLREIADTAIQLQKTKPSELSAFSEQLKNPYALRLLAFAAREAGRPELALATQQQLTVPAKLVDFLESALALSSIGEHQAALATLFNSGPDYYYGSRQKAAEFLYVVEQILPKAPAGFATPSWLEGLRKALAETQAESKSSLENRSCRPQS